MDAYAGKILFANLGTGSLNARPLLKELARFYLGGRGFGARILTDMVDPTIDPLSPENVLVFATGPLTGTGVPMGSRYEVTAKSPLTLTLSSANSGGEFGWKLKRSGFDALVVTGRADRPVYLLLNNGEMELRDASPYWGMESQEITEALQSDNGDKRMKVACIGPAGEKLSKMACIINEKARAAGRGGLGAVMGSKNLKAIATTGEQPLSEADDEALSRIKERVRNKVSENSIEGALDTYGTSVLVTIINESYIMPTRNFQSAHFPKADKLSGETIKDTILKKTRGCYACIVKCGRITEVDGKVGEGPEYETEWAFGPDCGIDDLAAITRANYRCNELGLDTISTGSTIACLMEMAERGYVDYDIRFGDAEKMLELVDMIAERRGIGDELAEGSYRFADRYGHPELSMSVKMQELPAYDPRGLQGHGLQYATSVRGGDHVYGYMISMEVLGSPEKLDPFTNEGKAKWTRALQDLTAAIDASGMCLFTSFALDANDYADLVAATTGMDIDGRGMMRLGERIWNLQRLFNMKVGYTKKDDTLPPRLLNEPLQEGAPAGRVWERQPLLDEYYSLRGWDRGGMPTPEKLEELGLSTGHLHHLAP
ncbi:MAG: aldehyde ferredoxin oxidoreductase family protein [Methanomicrobiaceae archaeon]|nr:aldehyde ferredoxin oxidoreductase family protein [Methanomicrobiaceae archaeon]